MGHIPPGQSDCLSVWSRNFNDIVNRYENTIAGHFYGHTHFDEFAIFFDKENTTRPFATAYVAPSITTFYSGKPTFRVYDVDGIYDNSTYQVVKAQAFPAKTNDNITMHHHLKTAVANNLSNFIKAGCKSTTSLAVKA